MSGSGYRGRGRGPRGAHSNGPPGGFGGPRFPHPNFNHVRPHLNRAPGPENWSPRRGHFHWQRPKFPQRGVFRGKLHYRPDGKGRSTNNHGPVRFVGSERGPATPFPFDQNRNAVLQRASFPQESFCQSQGAQENKTPLLGSEEERQQKFTETVDRLKQSLSSITKEEIINFWQDDLPMVPSAEQDGTMLSKGTSELRHEPSDLNLTFNDFRDIGRVDFGSAKHDNKDDADDCRIINIDDTIQIFEDGKIDSTLLKDTEVVQEDLEDTENTESGPRTLLDANECHGQTETEPLCNKEGPCLNPIVGEGNVIIGETSVVREDESLQRSRDISEQNIPQIILSQDENIMETNYLAEYSQAGSENNESMQNMEIIRDTQTVDSIQNTEITQSMQHTQYSDGTQCTEKMQNIEDPKGTQNEENIENVQNIEDTDIIQNRQNTENMQNMENIPNVQNAHNVTMDLQCAAYSKHKTGYRPETEKHTRGFDFQPRIFNSGPRFLARPTGPRHGWSYSQNDTSSFNKGFRLRHNVHNHHPQSQPPPQTSMIPPAFDPRISSIHPQPPTMSLNKNSFLNLPPPFDVSTQPPNIQPYLPTMSSGQRVLNNIVPPLSGFDPRTCPPSIMPDGTLGKLELAQLPSFNPQRPPPKIPSQEDPCLSSEGQINYLQCPPMSSPVSTTGTNLMEPASVVGSQAVGSFAQLPLVSPPFASCIGVNYSSPLANVTSVQAVAANYAATLPPPVNIVEIPKRTLETSPSEDEQVGKVQAINIKDGLDDMQEAMEFAKQVMNMPDKTDKITDKSVRNDPHSGVQPTLATSESKNVEKRKTRKKLKRANAEATCGPQPCEIQTCENQSTNDSTMPQENSVQNINSNVEEGPLMDDYGRPKVIFNLNPKTKRLNQTDEWHYGADTARIRHRTSINSPERTEDREDNAARPSCKKYSQRKLKVSARDRKQRRSVRDEEPRSNDASTFNRTVCQGHRSPITLNRNLSQGHRSPNSTVVSDSHKEPNGQRKKTTLPTSETSWKSRVINRFLKMSKNDICNMVNNSSLRKFDIAMKHLVKEKRSSLSLEMRNTEDEKIKGYDREEFMSQLNAMLDPGAVVDIMNLPTEFIHHLSEVLQLDTVPVDRGDKLSKHDSCPNIPSISDVSTARVTNFANEEHSMEQSTSRKASFDRTSYSKRSEYSNYKEGNEKTNNKASDSRNSDSSSGGQPFTSPMRQVVHQSRSEAPASQNTDQLFNMSDLDDIFSVVIARTKYASEAIEAKGPNTATETSACNPTSAHGGLAERNNTSIDLDDIFAEGMAKLASSKSANMEHSRARKSVSEDRCELTLNKRQRWHRKERENPDTFRNLTRDEWEAKYGNAANSLRDSQIVSFGGAGFKRTGRRFPSADSVSAYFSVAPLTHNKNPIVERRREPHADADNVAGKSRESRSSSVSSSSSSTTDQADADVTKLLKVIKEKEKLGKQRSLNETIRDEVTAEIEQMWKEKGKHRSRNSRKKLKKKKERKDRKRREKKKKTKKRQSYSSSRSDSGDSNNLGATYLTEDQIKKEVIVKEELNSGHEETVQPSDKIERSTKSANVQERSLPSCSRNESDVLATKVDTAVNANPAQVQNHNQSNSSSMQPKTKAQLKQMPETSGNRSAKQSVNTENTHDVISVKTNLVSEECITCQATNEDAYNINSGSLDKEYQGCKKTMITYEMRETNTEPTRTDKPVSQSVPNETTKKQPDKTSVASALPLEANTTLENEMKDKATVTTLAQLTGSDTKLRRINLKEYMVRNSQRKIVEKERGQSIVQDSANKLSANTIVEPASPKGTKVFEQLTDPRLAKNTDVTPAQQQEKNSLQINEHIEHLAVIPNNLVGTSPNSNKNNKCGRQNEIHRHESNQQINKEVQHRAVNTDNDNDESTKSDVNVTPINATRQQKVSEVQTNIKVEHRSVNTDCDIASLGQDIQSTDQNVIQLQDTSVSQSNKEVKHRSAGVNNEKSNSTKHEKTVKTTGQVQFKQQETIVAQPNKNEHRSITAENVKEECPKSEKGIKSTGQLDDKRQKTNMPETKTEDASVVNTRSEKSEPSRSGRPIKLIRTVKQKEQQQKQSALQSAKRVENCSVNTVNDTSKLDQITQPATEATNKQDDARVSLTVEEIEHPTLNIGNEKVQILNTGRHAKSPNQDGLKREETKISHTKKEPDVKSAKGSKHVGQKMVKQKEPNIPQANREVEQCSRLTGNKKQVLTTPIHDKLVTVQQIEEQEVNMSQPSKGSEHGSGGIDNVGTKILHSVRDTNSPSRKAVHRPKSKNVPDTSHKSKEGRPNSGNDVTDSEGTLTTGSSLVPLPISSTKKSVKIKAFKIIPDFTGSGQGSSASIHSAVRKDVRHAKERDGTTQAAKENSKVNLKKLLKVHSKLKVDAGKFKNIKSEGRKELKLKKERKRLQQISKRKKGTVHTLASESTRQSRTVDEFDINTSSCCQDNTSKEIPCSINEDTLDNPEESNAAVDTVVTASCENCSLPGNADQIPDVKLELEKASSLQGIEQTTVEGALYTTEMGRSPNSEVVTKCCSESNIISNDTIDPDKGTQKQETTNDATASSDNTTSIITSDKKAGIADVSALPTNGAEIINGAKLENLLDDRRQILTEDVTSLSAVISAKDEIKSDYVQESANVLTSNAAGISSSELNVNTNHAISSDDVERSSRNNITESNIIEDCTGQDRLPDMHACLADDPMQGDETCPVNYDIFEKHVKHEEGITKLTLDSGKTEESVETIEAPVCSPGSPFRGFLQQSEEADCCSESSNDCVRTNTTVDIELSLNDTKPESNSELDGIRRENAEIFSALDAHNSIEQTNTDMHDQARDSEHTERSTDTRNKDLPSNEQHNDYMLDIGVDAFDEDESFIVLDEYIDGMDTLKHEYFTRHFAHEDCTAELNGGSAEKEAEPVNSTTLTQDNIERTSDEQRKGRGQSEPRIATEVCYASKEPLNSALREDDGLRKSLTTSEVLDESVTRDCSVLKSVSDERSATASNAKVSESQDTVRATVSLVSVNTTALNDVHSTRQEQEVCSTVISKINENKKDDKIATSDVESESSQSRYTLVRSENRECCITSPALNNDDRPFSKLSSDRASNENQEVLNITKTRVNVKEITHTSQQPTLEKETSIGEEGVSVNSKISPGETEPLKVTNENEFGKNEVPKKLPVLTKAALKESSEASAIVRGVESSLSNKTDTLDADRSNERQCAVNSREVTENTDNIGSSEQSDTVKQHSLLKKSIYSIVQQNPVVELEKIKSLDHLSCATKQKLQKRGENAIDSRKLKKREEDKILRGVRDKRRMKHKQAKNLTVPGKRLKVTAPSHLAHTVGSASTKDEILARMVVIDMEIHKLMSEKMALYQMMDSDSLSAEKHVSQVITKTNSSDGHVESSRAVGEGPVNEKGDVSTSDDEEVGRFTAKTLNFKKRKKRSDDQIARWEDDSVSDALLDKSTSSDAMVDRKNDVAKLSIKGSKEKEKPMDTTAKRKSVGTHISDPQDGGNSKDSENQRELQSDSTGHGTEKRTESFGTRSLSKTMERKSKRSVGDGSAKTKRRNADENLDSCSDEEESGNDESETPGKEPVKDVENKVSERVPIYSDESTWESVGHNPASEENPLKKTNTGLALLEETYKREIALSRKVKAMERRKKKRQLQNVLSSVNVLTAEEEELPLNALYIRKLQQKKDLLDSLCEQAHPLASAESPNRWVPAVEAHVLEVINAVAGDKVKELYTIDETKRETDTHCAEDDPTERTHSPADGVQNGNVAKSGSESSLVDTYHHRECEKLKISSCEDSIPSVVTAETASSNEAEITEEFGEVRSTICAPCSEGDDKRGNYAVENKTEEKGANDTKTIDEGKTEDEDAGVYSSPSDVDRGGKDRRNNEIGKDDEDEEDDRMDYKNVQKLSVCQSMFDDETVKQSVAEYVTFADDTLSRSTSDGRELITSERKYPNTSIHRGSEELAPRFEGNRCENVETHVENSNIAEVIASESATVPFESACMLDASARSLVSPISKVGAIQQGNSTSKKMSRRRRFGNHGQAKEGTRSEESIKRVRFNETEMVVEGTEENESSQDKVINSESSTPISSFDEEPDNAPWNERKTRGAKKKEPRTLGRVRSEEVDGAQYSANANVREREEVRRVPKRRMAHSRQQMMTCKVRLVDSKYTLLKPDVDVGVLHKLGISTINPYTPSNPVRTASSNSTANPSLSSTKHLHRSAQNPNESDTRVDVQDREVQHRSSRMHSAEETGRAVEVDAVDELIDVHEVDEVDETNEVGQVNRVNDASGAPADSIRDVSADEPETTRDCPATEAEVQIVEEKNAATKDAQGEDCGCSTVDAKDEDLARTQYTVHKGPILDIQVFDDSFLAASEDGTIYRYSQTSNGILNIYKGHRSAVTCLYVHKASILDDTRELMYSGSLDGTLRCYNITSGAQVKDAADVGSPIQCIDQAWGVIFVGTKSGHVSRFHMKSGAIKGDSIQFSEKSVLALRATNEGPRRVLIVASRNQPVTIRDAQNGLFLRTICGQKNHTVYSLMRDNNFIYCGTSSTSIPVFDFTTGEQTMQYDAGVGIVCMRLYRKFLFAGCYDGNIYIFDTKDHRLVCSIRGPGNMLLSMEVIDNKIIAGSKDKRLHAWQMPTPVRALLQRITS